MSAVFKSNKGEREVHGHYGELLLQWPVAIDQHHVTTRQGDTFVVACGPKDAPPLLLLHGSGATSAMWMGDVATWAKAFRVYAVDMIGEPGLSAPSRPPLASEAHALWLDDVLRALALERVAICGVSLGGWLALDYATRRPERVEKLALLCPGGIGRQKILIKALPLLLLGPWGRRKVLEMVLGKRPANPTTHEKQMGEFVTLIFKHFRPRTEKLPVFSDAQLQRLTMPILAILGGKDVLLNSSDTKRRLEAHVPTAEVVFLPEAGHLLRQQTARVLGFLRGDSLSRGANGRHQTAA